MGIGTTVSYLKIACTIIRFIHDKTLEEIIEEINNEVQEVTDEVREVVVNLYWKLHNKHVKEEN